MSADDLAFDVEIYPENLLPLQVFMALQTQWRTGMGGATGLDYSAIPPVLALLGVKKKQHAEVFDALRIMEREALSAWSEQPPGG